MAAEYSIGVDLGTTNCVLAYLPLNDKNATVSVLPLPQLVAPGTIEARTSLPSFLYLGTEADAGHFDLPWAPGSTDCVGEAARRRGAEAPDRTVVGAKSWLTHQQVDRHAPILPWNAPPDVEKVSPVAAARRYLSHLIACWTQAFPNAPFEEQEVVLTVPASFDAHARELTREAAMQAGFPNELILLEEPQAAVYSWLEAHGDQWRKTLGVGDQLLVCDVGGGTTDFTLIAVDQLDGDLQLQRVAVGNHLLVGGDNMDLALAHHAASLFAEKGHNLDPWQSVSLWHSCRQAKEALLAPEGPDSLPVTVLGRGRKLIGGTLSVDLDRESVRSLLVDGFLPSQSIDDLPEARRTSGFQDVGLPYEADPAITKHLAAFLNRQGPAGAAARPTRVLLNGGVFKSPAIADRVLGILADWFPEESPQLLAGTSELDHAVARGAAYYGWSKRHGGVRIHGGTARSYYIGIETSGLAIPGAPRPLRALCVVPFGMEEGTKADVPSGHIGLVVGEAARFRFFSSTTRREDQPGDVIAHWSPEELTEADSLETTLQRGPDDVQDYVPVTFQSQITELGMMELWCLSARDDRRWKLEFSVREEPGA